MELIPVLDRQTRHVCFRQCCSCAARSVACRWGTALGTLATDRPLNSVVYRCYHDCDYGCPQDQPCCLSSLDELQRYCSSLDAVWKNAGLHRGFRERVATWEGERISANQIDQKIHDKNSLAKVSFTAIQLVVVYIHIWLLLWNILQSPALRQ